MWETFKEKRIEAERQWYLPVAQRFYCLDFAIFCRSGFLDVECDGDTWHGRQEQIAEDNERDNTLTSGGWSILRFNSRQIWQQMPQCVSRVCETINRYGGTLSIAGDQKFYSVGGEPPEQLALF